MPPVDDNYTVVYGGETSTVDNEYYRVKKWLEMSTLEEECGSTCSTNLTDENMLNNIVHGHKTKHGNTNGVAVQDAVTTNDSGCFYSASIESLTRDSGPYFSESVVFHHNKMQTTVSVAVQDESYIDNQETVAQSVPSQTIVTSPVPSGYVTLESQHQSHAQNTIETNNNKHEAYVCDSTTSCQLNTGSPVEAEEINENGKLSTADEFPSVIAKIQNNKMSSAMSEGEYLPYNAAVNQHNSSAVMTPSEISHNVWQIFTTENETVSMKSVKSPTPLTDHYVQD